MWKFFNSLKLLNRNVRLYILADGFYYAGYSVIDAFLSVLITTKLAPGRIDLVGFVIGYYMLSRSIVEIPISRLTRALKPTTKRNLVSGSYIVYGLLIMLMGYAPSLAYVFLIQTFASILDAIAYPLKWPIFAKSIDKEEELAWSLEDIAATALPAGFTMLAGSLAATFGLQSPFILFGALLITSGAIFRSTRPPTNATNDVVAPEQQMAIKFVVEKLQKNHIPFQISGGLAAIIYGAKNRKLFDVDIDVYGKDLPKITQIFSDYVVRPLQKYKDDNFDINLMTLKIDGLPVDITEAENMCFISKTGEKICENVDLAHPSIIDFVGMQLPVENKVSLIRYKRFLGRETDIKDAEEIERY